MDPTAIEKSSEDVVLLNEQADPVAWGFDDVERAHGFMIRPLPIHNRLPGKSDPQITLRAEHDSNPSRHVMVHFTAASIDIGIYCGQVMLHADPLDDHSRCGQDDLQKLTGGIALLIVRMQERTTFKIETHGQVSVSDNKCGIAR